MTGKEIINGWCDDVFRNRKKNKVFPNVFIEGFEADVLEVTKSGYAYEYEVKTSRSDFKADSKKRRQVGLSMIDKFELLKSGGRVNYFYYVVPEGLITPEEVPEFAGLVYAKYITCRFYSSERGFYEEQRMRFDTVKVAPRLSKDKFSAEKLTRCFESVYYRFHSKRMEVLP